MGITNLISICDTHWSERRPVSRLDQDWIGTQTSKIKHVFDLSQKRDAVAILHGGDLFHQPRGPLISRRVDQWLQQLLQTAPCPILAIPGNHDMQGHQLNSLKNHPYGCLEASGLIHSVIWPKYVLVGTDPIILVTGYPYVSSGAGPWMEELRQEQVLTYLKQELGQSYGVPVFVVALSHGFWSDHGGLHYGEPETPYGEIINTGIDVLVHGHDHSCNGIHPVESDQGFQYIIGPGALVRGTLGEADLRREPKIAILGMESRGNHELVLISVPHAPYELVFDLETSQKKKKTLEDDLMFIEECRKLDYKVPTIEVILSSMSEDAVVSPGVIALTWEYVIRAQEKELV